MRVLKLSGIKVFLLVIVFFAHNQVDAVLRIAIDIPQSLSKSFAMVRDYIVNGYSARHIFGMNHLIINAINKENERRRVNNEKPLSNKFSLQENTNIYLTFLYVDEKNDKASVGKIKRALREAVAQYKSIVHDTKFNFKVQKSTLFVSRVPTRLEIVQNVEVNTGLSNLNKLKNLIKKYFDKYKIESSALGLGVHVGYAKIKSEDQDLISLLRHDKKIENLLKSVWAPKGTADNFTVVSKINLYDGLKRLASYDL